jgi:ribosomal-protein-alanine N-acetyltransferase
MSGRLELVDATRDLIDAAIEGDGRLGALLGAAVAEGWPVFPDALPALRAMIEERPQPDGWGTVLFLLREPPTLVGMGGYKGPPSAGGTVEIGYAIAPAFRRRGLAGEAARRMVERAWEDPRVIAVEAHTLAEESASVRLLVGIGFVRVAEVTDPEEGRLWRWRLPRDAAEPATSPR